MGGGREGECRGEWRVCASSIEREWRGGGRVCANSLDSWVLTMFWREKV
jgi:hypothetical protein